MADFLCYLCSKQLPPGQSWYEDHQVKVCLDCFKKTTRCQRCKFPSNSLKMYPGIGRVCEFCQQELQLESGMECYLCHKQIPTWASFYHDYDRYVCQDCFRDAKRCFVCRFPQGIEKIQGLGHLCGFCQPTVIRKDVDVVKSIEPLRQFLSGFRHTIPQALSLQWIDWNILVGMQLQGVPPEFKIAFLDEFLHYCYPIYYFRSNMYLIPCLPREQFMVHMAGQLAAADICKTFGQTHLVGDNPFFNLARGWCHWVSYMTAKRLKYTSIQKQLERYPMEPVSGDFSKFLAMLEFRTPKAIVEFTHKTLNEYSQRYLK
ncbi:MAG: hypothetical protein HQM11_09195 [SAR324 cluster bacterium]|nr:hypothetical protein [SAR324 cluster bacterium]